MQKNIPNLDSLIENQKISGENVLQAKLDGFVEQSNNNGVFKSDEPKNLPEKYSQTNKNITSGCYLTSTLSESQSSGDAFLKRKKPRITEIKAEESKKDNKNFPYSNKIDNALKDNSIPLQETDYSKKHKNHIKSPKKKKPRKDELIHFLDYQINLLYTILRDYGSPSQLSRQSIITLFEYSSFKKFQKRTLSYLFSRLDEENEETINNAIQEEKREHKGVFNYFMNLTFKEAYANYLGDCNVFIVEGKIYIFQ